ncbi:hypothetical protein BC5_0016 [Bacillus phage BC-5]|uniref:Uncharacterized protein n=1 Tax=Bacillus phage BC-5 TaxID=3020389 RepID=A0AAE9YCA3_9CAUD|nr:hypothetical protein BC5_0016 [Bacillus phage BC-5]
MTGHRRQPKPKRYSGVFAYIWNKEFKTTLIENITIDEIQLRERYLLNKGVTQLQRNIEEIKVGKR